MTRAQNKKFYLGGSMKKFITTLAVLLLCLFAIPTSTVDEQQKSTNPKLRYMSDKAQY